ncbi:MAG: hypothetical protein ACLUJM_11135 [Finegoldia sp.]|uniref:hypothetical protein n=1 Tax=Finegoldia sp. TaxID=1981334 RepID=UPI003991C38C
MRVNAQNTKKILKKLEEKFDVHIPFSKKNYRNFSENFSRTDSFPEDVYQCLLHSYIYDSDIFAKIVQNCCKSHARFFSKNFPEFKEDFYSKVFVEDIVAFSYEHDMRLDLDEMFSAIYRSVEYLFYRKLALLLIYRNHERSKADNIIDENIDDIECDCWGCFSIDGVCDVAERYAN